MKKSGFTLIEVMIAMAIFSVSAMAILNATGQNVNTLGSLERKTLAAIVADNQLVLMTLEGLPQAEKNGSVEMAGEDWYWTIKPVPTADGMLKAVDVIVWNEKEKKSPLASVRTYAAAN